MTRINVIPVSELTTKHLVAEYREITRLPNNLKKSLSRKVPFSLDEIPKEYTMGTGHVKFFYNKMKYLQYRFEDLVREMKLRGYNPTYTDSSIFIPKDSTFYNDYIPTEKAKEINRERISLRLNKIK
ncbi:MAG: pyrimidine dimer DNA glycosylase/endonuclease V [Akkermansiaceae bacterium]|jgi:deoxyribonuclease (pyrimidine dimer)